MQRRGLAGEGGGLCWGWEEVEGIPPKSYLAAMEGAEVKAPPCLLGAGWEKGYETLKQLHPFLG